VGRLVEGALQLGRRGLLAGVLRRIELLERSRDVLGQLDLEALAGPEDRESAVDVRRQTGRSRLLTEDVPVAGPLLPVVLVEQTLPVAIDHDTPELGLLAEVVRRVPTNEPDPDGASHPVRLLLVLGDGVVDHRLHGPSLALGVLVSMSIISYKNSFVKYIKIKEGPAIVWKENVIAGPVVLARPRWCKFPR